MCWLVYACTICVYHLPMWLTLNFPNLCIYPYTYVPGRGGGPARREQKVNSLEQRVNENCYTFVLYYGKRYAIIWRLFAAGWMAQFERLHKNCAEWCIKNRHPHCCKNTLPMRTKQEHALSTHADIDREQNENIDRTKHKLLDTICGTI